MGGLLLTMIVVVMMHVLRVSRDLVHRHRHTLRVFPATSSWVWIGL